MRKSFSDGIVKPASYVSETTSGVRKTFHKSCQEVLISKFWTKMFLLLLSKLESTWPEVHLQEKKNLKFFKFKRLLFRISIRKSFGWNGQNCNQRLLSKNCVACRFESFINFVILNEEFVSWCCQNSFPRILINFFNNFSFFPALIFPRWCCQTWFLCVAGNILNWNFFFRKISFFHSFLNWKIISWLVFSIMYLFHVRFKTYWEKKFF